MRGTGMLLLTTEVSEPINRVRQPLPTIRSTGWFEISKSPACPRVSTHQNRPIPASPQVTAATERPPVSIASVTSSETPARRPSYFCPHVSAHPVLNHLLRSDPDPGETQKAGYSWHWPALTGRGTLVAIGSGGVAARLLWSRPSASSRAMPKSTPPTRDERLRCAVPGALLSGYCRG